MVWSRYFCFILFIVSAFSAQAQTPIIAYFVDKDSFSNEIDWRKYFSQDAIHKRELQGIGFNSYDLPVKQQYLRLLQEQDVEILFVSKWLNAVLINWKDNYSSKEFLLQNPFINRVEYLGGKVNLSPESILDTSMNEEKVISSSQSFEMLGLDKLIQKGLNGEGISIAVMDAGFLGVDTTIGFYNLNYQNKIAATVNLPRPGKSVFDYSEHGTKVLSILAGQMGEEFHPSASNAQYHLYVTEWIEREEPLEEFLLVKALEDADSAGIWVANISLGYAVFDDPEDNYSVEQIDGQTSILSKAVKIAASRGMLVVASAGNSGNSRFPYITIPADSDSILSVGALGWDGSSGSFSSFSSPSLQHVSPKLAAPGVSIATLNSCSEIIYSKGTSYAAPFITGACASLWQAFPSVQAKDIYEAVLLSARNFPNAHPQLGYGLPDFEKAYLLLEKKLEQERKK